MTGKLKGINMGDKKGSATLDGPRTNGAHDGGEAYDRPTVQVTLRDGTPAIVRPITPEDADALAAGLRELSPASQYHRFLRPVDRLSPPEIRYLTSVDGVNHLALGMAVLLPGISEPKPIGVARCVRDSTDPELAEAAIVISDQWQNRGAGRILWRLLAQRAWEGSIRRWKAVILANNVAPLRLMELVGTRRTQCYEGPGVIEVVYDLRAPSCATETGEHEGRPARSVGADQCIKEHC